MNNSLYRYRSVDKRTLEGLVKNEFYFTSPEDFNDPFDCKNLFSFKDSKDSDFRQFLRGQLKYENPHLSPKEITTKVKAIISSGIYRNKQTQEEQLKRWGKILDEESNKLGIVCLSKKHNDILMWSHYSNKHRGICLKFDKETLESQFFCDKVRYRQKYPIFRNYVTKPNDVYKMFLLTKSKHWKYEKEYRLITTPISQSDPEERKYTYPEKTLIGVIWGCLTTKKNKEKVKKDLKDKTHTITYYQAQKSKTAYSLKIKVLKSHLY